LLLEEVPEPCKVNSVAHLVGPEMEGRKPWGDSDSSESGELESLWLMLGWILVGGKFNGTMTCVLAAEDDANELD